MAQACNRPRALRQCLQQSGHFADAGMGVTPAWESLQRASTAIRSQPPSPTLAWMLTLSGSGGVHSTRLYWMLMRPPSMGAICSAPAAHPVSTQPAPRARRPHTNCRMSWQALQPAQSARRQTSRVRALRLCTSSDAHALRHRAHGSARGHRCSGSALWPRTLLKVSAWMSMWSVSHSGQTSVIVTVTLRWLGSLLQRPCAHRSAARLYRPADVPNTRTRQSPPSVNIHVPAGTQCDG